MTGKRPRCATPGLVAGRLLALLALPAYTPICFAQSAPQPVRQHELGLIDYYASYDLFDRNGRPVEDRRRPQLRELLEQSGLTVTPVDVDIFQDFRKTERDAYKRLLIPEFAYTLTEQILDGMANYVASGGLLIVNNSYFALDQERLYLQDAADKQTRIPERTFLGVSGHRSPVLTKLRVLTSCPLTHGVPVGTRVEIPEKAWARQTRNFSAEVVATGNVLLRGEDVDTVLISYRKCGDGASIYFGPFLRPSSLESPVLRTLLRNACSAETLQWLCAQP